MPTQKTTSRSTSRAGRPRTSRQPSRPTGDGSTAEQDGFTFVNVSFASTPPEPPQALQPLQPPAEIHSVAPPGNRSHDRGPSRGHPPSMFSRLEEGEARPEGDQDGDPRSAAKGRSTPDSTDGRSSPDIGAYSLLPGDTPYVPSCQPRSRVETEAGDKVPSPPRTRTRSASTRKKTRKSRATVVSSDDEGDRRGLEPPVLHQTESLKRGRANTVTANTSPSQSKRPRGSAAPAPPVIPSTGPAEFIDNEADVEVDPNVDVSADEASEADLDAYDSNDSFIDDSSVHDRAHSATPEEHAEIATPSVEQSSSSSPQSVPAVDVTFTTDSLLQSDTFVRALLSKLERERGLNLEGLSDEDQRMELARRDSLIMGMRPWLTSYSQSSPTTSPLATQQRDGRPTLRTPVAPPRRQTLGQVQRSTSQSSPSSTKSSNRKKDKGKARASAESSFTNEGVRFHAQDDGDNSQFDNDTRRAMRESARAMLNQPGESSVGQPSTSSAPTQGLASASTVGSGPSTFGAAHAGSAAVATFQAPFPLPVAPSTPSSSGAVTAPVPVTPPANPGAGQASHVTGGNSVNPTSLSSRCPSLPPVCEVTNTDIQDPLLAATYHSCVALLARQYIPWSELQGPGQVNVSAWADQCPNMSMNLIIRALVFERSANYVNPSRADPRITRVRELPGTSPRYNLYVETGAPLIAVTVGFLEFSQLTVPSDTGLRQRFVRIIGHTQEWERQQGFSGMGFGFPSLHTQLSRDSLQISTRALSTRRGPDGTPGGRSTPHGMFNRNSALNNPSSRVSADLFSLPADQPVPTYDARGSPNLDFDTAMPFLATILPAWQHGEIPYGSAVLVAYTMTVYRSNAGNWTLGCNIQFVVVLGTPASFDH